MSAYDHFGSLVAVPIGLAVVGPVADRAGIDATLWIGGAIVAATILAQLLVSDIRQLRRATVQPVTTAQ